LNLSSEQFVCGSNTYRTLMLIPNGGNTSNPGSPKDSWTNSGGGGPHIWDGIVAAILSLSTDTLSQYLPSQSPTFVYILQKVGLVVEAIVNVTLTIYMTGFSGTFLLLVVIWIIWQELIYLTAILVMTGIKLVRGFFP
jgi:hypothetical protein